MLKTMKFCVLLTIAIFIFTVPAIAGHYEKPPKTNLHMHIAGFIKIGGEWAKPGDEVSFFAGSGRIVGVSVIKKEGILGDTAIAGNSELTAEIKGAKGGEDLEIRVWQKSTGKEYAGNMISAHSPEKGESLYTPYPGPALKFEAGRFYLLNIDAE